MREKISQPGGPATDPHIAAYFAGELSLSELGSLAVPLHEAYHQAYPTDFGPLTVREDWFKPPRRGKALFPNQPRFYETDLQQYLHNIKTYPLLTKAGEVALGQRKDIGKLAEHELEVAATPEDERVLSLLVHEGKMAFDAFYKSNTAFVVHVARKFGRKNMGMLDAIQNGNIGLHRAVEKFEWQKGFKFSTLADDWIKQALQKAAANESGQLHVPVHVASFLKALEGKEAEFQAEHGRSMTVDEIAQFYGKSPESITEMLRCREGVLFLDAPADGVMQDKRRALGEITPDATSQTQFDRVEDNDLLRDALRVLSPEEREVIALRFGFDGVGPRTTQEVCQLTANTSYKTTQLEKNALEKMRQYAGV